METYLSSRPYRIQRLFFFFPLRAFQKHQTKFRKQNCGAGNENPVFELRRFFFSNVVLLFFWGWLFFTVLARFHSCFHFFIMVCLTKIVGLFYNWPQKTWYVATPWFRIWANALTDKLSFMSLSAKQTILKVLLLSKNSIFHIWIFCTKIWHF